MRLAFANYRRLFIVCGMARYSFITALALLSVSCSEPRGGTAGTPHQLQCITQPAVSERDWIGAYASTSEIRVFSGTVLVVEKDAGEGPQYRMRSYSDVSLGGIKQDEQRGSCLIDGRSMYLPVADGYMQDGKPKLTASIIRYTMMGIHGRKILMRDDALRIFREQNKLYDYGILVKVKDVADFMLRLSEVEHPSIKVLYSDPTKPWDDPFVHGPNDP